MFFFRVKDSNVLPSNCLGFDELGSDRMATGTSTNYSHFAVSSAE
jgi:hypothetical protein